MVGEVALADLTDGSQITYGIVQPGKFLPNGVGFLRGGDIAGGTIKENDLVRIAPEIARPYGRSELKGGELVISLVANPGEVALVPAHLAGFNVARNVGIIRVNERLVHPRFLFLLLRAPATKSRLLGFAVGSVQSVVNLAQLREFKVALPSRDQQESIAELLGALDDKIELNRRTADTLEVMARALFKSWFVDFDPVRAKAEGCAPDLADGLDALFPNRLTKDGVPEGWTHRSLSGIGRFLNGLALQKYEAEPDGPFLPVVKIAELRSGPTPKSGRASTNIPTDYVVEDGDHLFSWSGSLTHVRWSHGRGALNQHLFKVTPKGVPAWLTFHAVEHHLPEFQAIASGKAVTMGHIQRHHLDEALVAIPDQRLMEALDRVFSPLFERSLNLAFQSRALSSLRDTLLPKLISGELRIRDAERAVAAA